MPSFRSVFFLVWTKGSPVPDCTLPSQVEEPDNVSVRCFFPLFSCRLFSSSQSPSGQRTRRYGSLKSCTTSVNAFGWSMSSPHSLLTWVPTGCTVVSTLSFSFRRQSAGSGTIIFRLLRLPHRMEHIQLRGKNSYLSPRPLSTSECSTPP